MGVLCTIGVAVAIFFLSHFIVAASGIRFYEVFPSKIQNIFCSIYVYPALLLDFVLVWLVQSIYIILSFPFVTAETRADGCGHIFRYISYLLIDKFNPFWHVHVLNSFPRGLNHEPNLPTKKIILMMPHLSSADPFLSIRAFLPRDGTWIAKAVLFVVPFGGWAMGNADDLPVYFLDKHKHNDTSAKDAAAAPAAARKSSSSASSSSSSTAEASGSGVAAGDGDSDEDATPSAPAGEEGEKEKEKEKDEEVFESTFTNNFELVPGTAGPMLERARAKLRRGRMLCVFPEGTRSEHANRRRYLEPFRLGFFDMALEEGAMIVPLAITGTNRVWPRGSLLTCPSDCYFSYGDVIDARDFISSTALAAVVRERLIELREQHPDRQG